MGLEAERAVEERPRVAVREDEHERQREHDPHPDGEADVRRVCVMYSGPSASGANFAMPASAMNTPRRNGADAASSAHRTSAPTSASLTLQFIA